MNKKDIKNQISKYAEQIDIEFFLSFEEDGYKATLNIDAWCDGLSYVLETVIEGTDKELEPYQDYEGLKKSFITKYDNWVKWFKENYPRTEIKENRWVSHC